MRSRRQEWVGVSWWVVRDLENYRYVVGGGDDRSRLDRCGLATADIGYCIVETPRQQLALTLLGGH